MRCPAEQLLYSDAVEILKDVFKRADQRQQAFYPGDNSRDGLVAVYICLNNIMKVPQSHSACQQVVYKAALALQDLNADILQPAQDSRHSHTEWYEVVAYVKEHLESLPQLAAQSVEAIDFATAQEE